MPFRINSKQLFLTYPQCNADKQVVADYLQTKFKDYGIDKYVVAHELHENGDDHLHCYFKLERPVNSANSNFADLLIANNRWHGNYQGCRSAKNVLQYCTKKEDYVANFDISDVIKAASDRRKIIADELINKKRPLNEVVEEYPMLIFEYKRLKENVELYWKDKEDERLPIPDFLPNPWNKQFSTKIIGKRRHYWIFSRQPDMGKTYHFATPLFRAYKSALKSGDFSYWNLRGDEEMLILDEYNTAKLKYDFLNSMCDGNCEYRIFMGGVKALKNPLIIILSNQPIYELYPNMNSLLYARFNEEEIY